MRRRVLTIVLVVLAVAGLAAAMSLLPRYQITAFGWREGGGVLDAWRLASAHFVHVDARHLAINLAAASLLLAAGIWQQGLGATLAAAAAAMLAVDVGLLAGPWPIEWYVGMSGLLHGLFAWLALSLVLQGGDRAGRLIAALLVAGGTVKVWLDLAHPLGEAGWLGVPLATPTHLYGWLGGLACALVAWWLRRR
ncbi:MAG: hypothetical protein R3E45_15005 [Rhodocyclaceae bacterium]|nr:hypothetical protein [Rhodocyclaceae bacterium]MCP5233514.1 rhombosortase [Zoogloeaceae bacterium]MCP5241737.1 rhombosortase [Zoogloeaceae bacterium]MCW5617370.1 hypothetical protein [Rhodocyclaceae bacterium]